MFKILTILLVAFNLSFAQGIFKRFDIVEINSEFQDDKNKRRNVKYGVVISGEVYNGASKYVVVVPMTQKKKDYKGAFVYNVKHLTREYHIFIDKPRNVEKSRISKSSISLKESEKNDISKKFNDVLN
jgi:mRNA-degrading endonuclease toxin of MazEF toxin-antitoxin module